MLSTPNWQASPLLLWVSLAQLTLSPCCFLPFYSNVFFCICSKPASTPWSFMRFDEMKEILFARFLWGLARWYCCSVEECVEARARSFFLDVCSRNVFGSERGWWAGSMIKDCGVSSPCATSKSLRIPSMTGNLVLANFEKVLVQGFLYCLMIANCVSSYQYGLELSL